MAILTIQMPCGRCGGSGSDDNRKDAEDNPIVVECSSCGGTGLLDNAKMDVSVITDELDWLKKKVKKILQKLEIPEE